MVKQEITSSQIDPLSLLTERELRYLTLASEGKTNNEIRATEFYYSPCGVENTFGSIFRKLGVKSRQEALAKISREGSEHETPGQSKPEELKPAGEDSLLLKPDKVREKVKRIKVKNNPMTEERQPEEISRPERESFSPQTVVKKEDFKAPNNPSTDTQNINWKELQKTPNPSKVMHVKRDFSYRNTTIITLIRKGCSVDDIISGWGYSKRGIGHALDWGAQNGLIESDNVLFERAIKEVTIKS